MLVGLVSYMTSDEMGTGTVSSTESYKLRKAVESWTFNRELSKYMDLYPERMAIDIPKVILNDTVDETSFEPRELFVSKLVKLIIILVLPLLLASYFFS